MKDTIIVVGAGIGGLVAAAELAHKGHAVTLVEQGAHVGGKMHQVLRDGEWMSTGPTVMTMRDVFDDLFMRLGAHLDDFVTLRPLDTLARHMWDDAPCLDLYTDPDRNEAAIATAFGGSAAQGYRDFAKYCESLHRLAAAPFIYAARPTWLTPWKRYGMGALAAAWRIDAHRSMMRALQGFFPHTPQLRQLFGRYATYTGGSPWRAPATLNLIAHVERMGVWSVDGGMHALAQGVARLAEAQGARILLGQQVQALITRDRRITGVRMQDGTQLSADAVVFNGDARAIKHGLVPIVAHDAPTPMLAKRASTQATGLSAITWGARRVVQKGRLAAHTVLFASGGGKAEFDALFEGGPSCPAPTVYICAPKRVTADADDKIAAQGPEPLFCLVNAPPTQHVWRAQKRALATQQLMHRLQACGVALEHAMTADDILHTPSCHAARFLGSDGALYGEAPHGMRHFLNRPHAKGPVAGLYLAGGGVHPGAGVPMAALSGRLAADAVHADVAKKARHTARARP